MPQLVLLKRENLQATIGFGTRATGICWSAAVIMTIQNISGMILDGVWVGIVFAKVRCHAATWSAPCTGAHAQGRPLYALGIASVATDEGSTGWLHVF